MTQDPDRPTLPVRPAEVVAARMRALRKSRGWSAQRLADEMAGQGLAWGRDVVASIEVGRRSYITVDELLALAVVFTVPVISLLATPSVDPAPVTPARSLPYLDVQMWLRSWSPLAGAGDDPVAQAAWNAAADVLTRTDELDAAVAQVQRSHHERNAAATDQYATVRVDLEALQRACRAVVRAGVQHIPLPPDVYDVAFMLGVDLPGATRSEWTE